MKKLLLIILLLIGAGGGIGAGLFLRPAPATPEAETACAKGEEGCAMDAAGGEAMVEAGHGEAPPEPPAEEADPQLEDLTAAGGPEYVALERQMIVPIVSADQVISLVVLSLSIEVQSGFSDQARVREPKLRDAFLQVLFRHANTGGFSGDFTSGEKMADLRRALNRAAGQVLGPAAIQVLVTDILRQAT